MKHNILLVDDSRTDTRIASHILGKQGYNIFEARSGEEALEMVKERDYSMMLLDVNLPGINGFEVAQRLRTAEESYCFPIIFVTGTAADESAVFDGYDAGGVDYLLKPLDPDIVRRKVQIFCELQEKEKKIQAQLVCIEAQNSQLENQLAELRAIEAARMESEIRYRSLVSLSPQAILVQVDDHMVFYNASAMQMLGAIDESSMTQRPFHNFVHESDRDRVREWMESIARCGGRGEPIECSLDQHVNSEDMRHVELHACCILYDDVAGIQMAIQDITEHKILEEKLRRLSQIDGLTGVWNRRCFDEHLALEWGRHARSETPLSLLMIDLDKFKNYNDTYGHVEGDNCLRTAARIMKNACGRPADFVARYGGEEFAILLPETDREGAIHIASHVVLALADLKLVHSCNRGHGIVTISCGVATLCPDKDQAPESIIAIADSALYEAKEAGGNRALSARIEKSSPAQS